MPTQVADPPAQKLAGKRTEGPVMRNGVVRTNPRAAEIIASDQIPRNEKSSGLDDCSSAMLEQRLRALEGANVIRLTRADIRRRLFSGDLDFDEFLDEMPGCCAKVPVVKLVRWLPNIGLTKARKIVAVLATARRELAEAQPRITEDTRMGELAPQDKYVLSALVHRHIDGYRGHLRAA